MLVRRVVHLAQFFLNRLHLLIQIVLALAFFHLLFDAVTDTFFNLKQVNFRFHHRHQVFQTFGDIEHLQYRLLVAEFQRHVRGDGIRQARSIVDAVQ
ncbi:hypothetical protein D3C78_1107600 [compost metagenome]